MFKRRTLFIVGAGASAEVGLPAGIGLARIIARKLDVNIEHGRIKDYGDAELFSQVRRQYTADFNDHVEAAIGIRDGISLVNSIDDFLDIHSGNVLMKRIGKAAIVKSVIEAERTSKLFPDYSTSSTLNYGLLDETWYVKFMRILGRSRSLPNVETIFENITFLVFNYDRCIEQFLGHAVQQLYGIKPDQAAGIVTKLNVIHPYGSVGLLATVPYGGRPHGQIDYLALGEHIRTYTEQIVEQETLTKIREEVEAADQIIFLGFAFHDQNMALLKQNKQINRKMFFGTAYKISNNDTKQIEKSLMDWVITAHHSKDFKENFLNINNRLTCSQLFDYYAKSIVA
jgi:hypothetical protein